MSEQEERWHSEEYDPEVDAPPEDVADDGDVDEETGEVA